jgi:hypothetical protein
MFSDTYGMHVVDDLVNNMLHMNAGQEEQAQKEQQQKAQKR